jgi:hypothetical protein
MAIVRYTLEEALKLRGKSDDQRLKNMTEEDIERAAAEDPDNPILTEEELKQFKPAVHRGSGVYAHEKSKPEPDQKATRKLRLEKGQGDD